MFVGAMPPAGLLQMVRAIDFNEWPAVYVCCSGIFRVERIIRERAALVDIHSNDVSLLTTAIGKLATGEDMELTFIDKLAWIEAQICNKSVPTLRERLAALVVAGSYAQFAAGSDNVYKQRHRRHLENGFELSHKAALEKVDKLVREISIQSYFAGDMREHVRTAIARGDGAGVVGFPPTYKGGYEAPYKFIHANTRWPEPSYGIWDPKTDLPQLMDELDAAGVPWYLGGDFVIEGRKPIAELRPGRNHPIYGYASASQRHSYNIVNQPKAKPFDYAPLDPAKLTATPKIEFTLVDSQKAAFLKDVYLAKNIVHSNGEVNVQVFLDGMLAGQLVFTRPNMKVYHADELYLLSDLATTREAKVAKLIAMLSTAKEVIDFLAHHYVRPVSYLFTRAFAKHPVSMKYRGAFELLKRAPTDEGFMLNYGRDVSGESAAEIYAGWWRKHGERETRQLDGQAGNRGPDGRSADAQGPRQKRPLHDRAADGAAGRKHQARRTADVAPADLPAPAQ